MTRVSVEPWGGVPGLGNVDLWRLETPQVQVQVLTLGATIRAVHCIWRTGACTTGCWATMTWRGRAPPPRIAGGRFSVEGKEYQLDINSGPNAIHGGLRGFNKGYPGAVDVSVTYTLQEETLTAEYRARSTKTTPINLTNHSYFNLAGQGEEDIYGHQVSIRANREVRAVEGTPFDLREPVLIGTRLKEVPAPGFDHNYCVSLPSEPWVERAAASQPGVQFYTANVLDGSVTGKGGFKGPYQGLPTDFEGPYQGPPTDFKGPYQGPPTDMRGPTRAL
ncbi:unnamed protein product [Menidia menidia]|uniref:Galactose mutarotase n=1 Tax=Menidia menidia TaxID=238744 RepID=A0A8S4BE65_9TELE|nr:unnamed protein product [Menidia menidia]